MPPAKTSETLVSIPRVGKISDGHFRLLESAALDHYVGLAKSVIVCVDGRVHA
jgi:hypothetical protein